MAKREGKSRSWRKPLKEISNCGESSKSPRKKASEDDGRVRDDALDRLLLAHSDLSSLIHQIDELVVQAIKVKATSGDGRNEIESFTHALSDMSCSLKPWVHKFQKALSSLCMKAENQVEHDLTRRTIPVANENVRNMAGSPEKCLENSLISPLPLMLWGADCTIERGRKLQKAFSSPCMKTENQVEQDLRSRNIPVANENVWNMVESPEKSPENSLISPSPLVSWRANCTIERGRQLFLLTPLSISKTLSPKQQGSHQSTRISFNALVRQPSFCTISEDANDNLLEVVEAEPVQNNISEPTTEEQNTSDFGFASPSPPNLPKTDCSMLVATPCLKMSPPKSCVWLEPVSKFPHKEKGRYRRATPFPRGVPKCQEIEMSESPTTKVSKSLALKYPELFGIKPADKLRVRREEVEGSDDWFMSPPKTCVLMEPLDERNNMVEHDDVQNSCHLVNKILNQATEFGGSSAVIECTPMWREPRSTIRAGKRPGETTLKKELWTRFEAASIDGLHFDVSVVQSDQKGFLDRLEEVSCDETSPMPPGLR